MALIIEVRAVKQHGLETFQIVVNGTLLNTYLCQQFAEIKAQQYLQEWNNSLHSKVRWGR